MQIVAGTSRYAKPSLALAAALAAIAAGPASAGTVGTRDVDDSGGFLSATAYFTADPGERNRLTVSWGSQPVENQTVTIHDDDSPITAAGMCHSVDANTARCETPRDRRGGISNDVVIDLGDGDDELRVDPIPITTSQGESLQSVPILSLTAGPGDDRVYGDDGPDTIDGGGGRDELYGGDGGDRLTDGDRDGASIGAPDADILDGGGSHPEEQDVISYSRRRERVEVSLGEAGGGGRGEGDVLRNFEELIGGAGGDRLEARSDNEGVETVKGGPGDDEIIGGGGTNVPTELDEILDGEGGDDIVRGGGGNDHANGGRGKDRLIGGLDGDTLEGGGDKDLLTGGPGDDDLSGAGGRDRLRAHSGDDFLHGGSGRDRVRAGAGNDSVAGGSGRDVLSCGRGRDRADADWPAQRGRILLEGRRLLPPTCESVFAEISRTRWLVVPTRASRVRSRSARFRIGCPLKADDDDLYPVRRCRGRLTVRSASGALLAAGTITRHRGGVRASLTPLGRLIAERRGSVVATLTAEYARGLRAVWTIRLRFSR